MELKDNFELFNSMHNDSTSQPVLYQPGRYWATKTKNAVNEIKRCGIENFRGISNMIGLSYADGLYVDVRDTFNFGLMSRVIRWLTKRYPLSKIYDSQVHWTESYANESLAHIQELLNLKTRTKNLLKKYKIPFSLLGGCLRKANIDGQMFSTHYLDLLEQHDNIASYIQFDNAKSIFEIGGGFGTNVHLLLENYKNIKKVLYLDIFPNLYVGTQYLKVFYGDAVSDYRKFEHLDSIKFSNDDDIEIFCITPWQIEKFKSEIDIFMNSHSFVEMPEYVVKNYVDVFKKFPNATDSAVALTTYGSFDLNTTFHPNKLPKFFKDNEFDYFEADTLLNSSRKNLYYVSPGKLSKGMREKCKSFV